MQYQTEFSVPNLIGYNLDEAISILDSYNLAHDLQIESEKHGIVTYQYPKDGMIYRGKSVHLVLDDPHKNDETITRLTYVTPPYPSSAVEYCDHHHQLYNACNTWEEARDFCFSQNGYLAVINSKAENDFLYSYILSLGEKNAYFGCSDSIVEGEWVWENDQLSAQFTNWHSGEPNGENKYEDYAMCYYKFSNGIWNDGDFDRKTVSGGSSFIYE